jgi:hypothetical protein
MKCAVHTEVDATGFCRNCGKGLCAECARDVRGILYCEVCLAALVSKPQPVAGAGNPTLAAVLGFVPGLGAVYNGEYMKAVVHVLILVGLIGLANRSHGSGAPLFGLLIAAFWFYMPIEAYRTAKAKMLGQAPRDVFVDRPTKYPIGPVVLIVIGAVILLSNLGLINLDRIADFWPVALIAVGFWLLWRRMQASPPSEGTSNE